MCIRDSFYMKQYMESTLPLSLIEAARIDGSGEFHTFNTIVMQMCIRDSITAGL